MEPLYEVQGIMDENVFRSMYLCMFKRPLIKVLNGILIACVIVLILLNLFFNFFAALFWAAVVVLYLFYPKILANYYVKDMAKTAKLQYMSPYTVRFFLDEMVEFTPSGEQHVRYDQIFEVKENAEAFFVMINRSQGYVLFKKDMTKGSPSSLTAFLRDQMHVSYNFI